MTAPLTFSDEQLIEALKQSPPAVQGQVAVIAMQQELAQRRAAADAPKHEEA